MVRRDFINKHVASFCPVCGEKKLLIRSWSETALCVVLCYFILLRLPLELNGPGFRACGPLGLRVELAAFEPVA